MNGRDRALRALRGEPVDRTPIYSNFRTPAAIEEVTGLKFDDDPFAATSAAYRRLEIDITKEIMIPAKDPPPGFRVNSTGYGFMRDAPEVDDYAGFLEKVRSFPSTDQLRDKFDFDAEINSLKAWFDRQQSAVGDAALITGAMGGCFDPCYERFGYETFMTAVAEEPGAVEECILHYAAQRRLQAEVFVSSECSDIIWYNDDIAHPGGTLVSPKFLTDKWLPHVKWALEPLFEAGIFVVFHSDGDIRKILAQISDAGFRGLHPLEPKAHMNPSEIKPGWGDRFTLFGGICPVDILLQASEDEVRAEVRRLLDTAAPGGGYFIGSAGMCGPDVPTQNALAWIDEAASYGSRFHNHY